MSRNSTGVWGNGASRKSCTLASSDNGSPKESAAAAPAVLAALVAAAATRDASTGARPTASKTRPGITAPLRAATPGT